MVTAVDISQKAIDVLKLNKSEKLEVVHSSLEDFHPTKQYDLILAINVLAFCPADRIQEIWDKMYQSLNKHGFLLCTLPVPIGREFARWYVSKNDMSQLFIQNRYKVIRSTHLTDKNTVHPLALTLQKV
jgi:chemotaxis methyl-accepting protein methylase